VPSPTFFDRLLNRILPDIRCLQVLVGRRLARSLIAERAGEPQVP